MNTRISIFADVCHSKPVIKGTRVLVSNILGSLASGETNEEVLEDYPNIAIFALLSILAVPCLRLKCIHTMLTLHEASQSKERIKSQLFQFGFQLFVTR